MKHVIVLLCLSLLMISCSWVELTDEGKAIRIVKQEDVVNCEKVGKVFAQLKDQIAGFDRNADTIKREIETLARNTAAASDLGGDTIVPVTSIKKGTQTYEVYKCMRPSLKMEDKE
jgi:hypothetical protein